MRVEVFLQNGKKQTVDNVISIKEVMDKDSNIILSLEYSKNGEGDFSTCDQPFIGYPAEEVDMLKVFNIGASKVSLQF